MVDSRRQNFLQTVVVTPIFSSSPNGLLRKLSRLAGSTALCEKMRSDLYEMVHSDEKAAGGEDRRKEGFSSKF
jgi:hypothetical protein